MQSAPMCKDVFVPLTACTRLYLHLGVRGGSLRRDVIDDLCTVVKVPLNESKMEFRAYDFIRPA